MSKFPLLSVLAISLVLTVLFGGSVAADAGKKQPSDNVKKKLVDETQLELKKLQGLWQKATGGMVHRDGKQVVYQPGIDPVCFFVHGNRLIWLDTEGKPSSKGLTIKLEVTTDPKRITLIPVGDGKGKKPIRGIYSATGASLHLHVGLDGGPAPKQFLERNKPVKGVDGSEWIVGRRNLQGWSAMAEPDNEVDRAGRRPRVPLEPAHFHVHEVVLPIRLHSFRKSAASVHVLGQIRTHLGGTLLPE